ncbi:MAG: carboxypeptidase-like regulatory domain-containing protein [Parashewanella sp.]
MKLLKTISVISAITLPLAVSATSLLEHIETYAEISSEVPITLSTIDNVQAVSLDNSRKIPQSSNTSLDVNIDDSGSWFNQEAQAQGYAAFSAESAVEASLAPHRINCKKAFNLKQGNVYSDSITTVGEQHCYIMPLDKKSKVVGQLLAADKASDFNLYLYQYDKAKKLLAHVDSSEKPAGVIEKTYAVLPQASFILVAELKAGAGGSFNFIGDSFDQFDTFEPNDSGIVSKIPKVNVGRQLIGNLDNPADVDYFAFKLKDNETELRLFVKGSAEHQIEFLHAGSWKILPHKQTVKVKGAAGATYFLRALAKPNTKPSALNNYQVSSSYGSIRISSYDLWTTDKNLTDLVDYVDTEAHSNLSAKGKVTDASGNPVIGEEIKVVTIINSKTARRIVKTDAQGRFNASFDLPDCQGYTKTIVKASNFGTPRNMWRITYKPSQKVIMAPTDLIHDEEAHREWNYIHICREEFIRRITR